MYKVIIIEDDPMVASINKQYVELTSSFHVEATFKNGILALQYLQNCTVDLIILDYYTPQMNGDEFIDQLHAAGMTPAIIMGFLQPDAERLVICAFTDTEYVAAQVDDGAFDAGFGQIVFHAVGNVALGDGAEVNRRVRGEEG